jgi:hypothetical protein
VRVESSLGRLRVDANRSAASGVRANGSIVTAGLRDDVCAGLRDDSYRKAMGTLNRLSGRSASGEELSVTFAEMVVTAEGKAFARAKHDEAASVLSAYGDAFDERGVPVARTADELPEGLRQTPVDELTVDPEEVMDGIDGSWRDAAGVSLPDALGLDEGELEGLSGAAAPYSGGCKGARKRRGSREEVAAAAKRAVLEGYVRWLNSSEKIDDRRKVLRAWQLELDSSQVCYVTVDAVLVDEQAGERVRGGKTEMRDGKTYVKHWNVRVEADGTRYAITSTDESEAYLELMACLVSNGLTQRRLVFITDGETRIKDSVDERFAPWAHDVFLDWHHLQEKVYLLMSSMICGRRVDDPDAEVERYKRGKNKGKPKPCGERTSLSRLYAKEACLIAWAGNVAQLIAYIRCIPKEDVKDESARAMLIGYLKRKADMITCYALRKRVGLINSSNGSEQQNQLLVSQRQKQPLMAWRETGSAALASVTSMYRNGEDVGWFGSGKATLSVEGFGRDLGTVA